MDRFATALGRAAPAGALRLLLATAALAAAGAAPPAQALPAWPTYHRDATRTGADPDGTAPLTPTLAWQSPNLGAPMWNQPLVLAGRVYAATIGDQVYALDASSGAVIWHTSAGTPVPATALPCGDVKPTVGIVGTPVIDQASGVLYAVADTWDGSSPHHFLDGFRLSDGALVLSTPVDPPGADPKAILQRTALNLDGGNVVFGYGGNDGDCSTYKGAVVSAPENGGAPSFWQVPIAAPSSGGGAVWATGGPAVDANGTVYASTGNPNPPGGQEATTFDDSDAVVSLTPSMGLSGWYEPPTWRADSNSDRDLSSGAPELLPGGLLFQAGKNGTGYLIDEATMSTGAPAVYSAQVCGGSGSFGGDSYSGGVIYIPCTNGTQALAYNAGTRTFSPLWQGPSDAFGPPIVSAGLVWTVATGGFSGGGTKLYGLDPATGKPRYTLTLPSPVTDHFASPSAAGGRVLLATGSTVTAFQTAVLTAFEEPSGSAPPKAAAPPVDPPVRLLSLLVRALRVGPHGFLHLRLRCPASGLCRGSVSIRATRPLRPSPHARHAEIHVLLGRASFAARRGTFTLAVRIDRLGRTMLSHHRRGLRVTLTLGLADGAARKVDAALHG
jgi:outer membrane protein assembly factor BamB